jgi:hypothetical protein
VYRKTDNNEGRKRVIGYQLVVIEELKMIIHDSSRNQEAGELDGEFETILTRLEADLKNHWKDICCSDDHQTQQHLNTKSKKKTKQGDLGDDDGVEDGIGSLDCLLARVNVLFARASANRFLQ